MKHEDKCILHPHKTNVVHKLWHRSYNNTAYCELVPSWYVRWRRGPTLFLFSDEHWHKLYGYVNSQNKRFSVLSREVILHTFKRRAMRSFQFYGHKIHSNMLHIFWHHFDTLARLGQNKGLRLFVLSETGQKLTPRKIPYIFLNQGCAGLPTV